jgi:hypothetical protein
MSDALNVLRPHDANVVTGDVRKYLVELDVLLGLPIIEGCGIPQASPITAGSYPFGSISSWGAKSTPNGAAVSEHSQNTFENGSDHAIAPRSQKAERVRFSDTRMLVKVTSQGRTGAR